MTVYKAAKAEEANLLSDLAIESKGYWGYPKHLLDVWRNDLRIEKDYIEKNVVRTIWKDEVLVGFFAITIGDGPELEHLWLRPNVIGTGIGKIAFSWVVEEFKERDIKYFDIVSDPNAETFYLGMGAIRIGEVESIPQDRFLPKLRYNFKNTEQAAGGDRPR